MKKKKKSWLKVLIVILVIGIIVKIIVDIAINSVSSNINGINEADLNFYLSDYKVKEENITSYVKGTGEITSFNIKMVEVPSYGNVKENYVKDGDIVKAKQKVLRTSIDGYSKIIYSPIEGMYFEIESNGEKTYRVYDLKNIGVEVLVSENDSALLKEGQKAFVKINALNKEVEGKIDYISKLPVDGRFKVRVKIDYSEDIKFGYGASIKIVVEEKENVLVIPYSALQMDDEDKYYVIKEENKMNISDYIYNVSEIPDEYKTYVEIGTISNNLVEIKSGLKSGDVIEEWNE